MNTGNTVSEALKAWLKTCPIASVVDVDTDRLEAQAEACGIYKQANRVVVDYVDGSKLITEYYYFLTRQATDLESDRVGNQEFLENLEHWIDDQNEIGALPNYDGVETVEITNGFYMQESEEDEAVYQVSLGITYLRERN